MRLLQASVQEPMISFVTFHLRNTLLSPVGLSCSSQLAGLLAQRLRFQIPSHFKVKQWIHMKSQLYSGGTALDFHQLPF